MQEQSRILAGALQQFSTIWWIPWRVGGGVCCSKEGDGLTLHGNSEEQGRGASVSTKPFAKALAVSAGSFQGPVCWSRGPVFFLMDVLDPWTVVIWTRPSIWAGFVKADDSGPG